MIGGKENHLLKKKEGGKMYERMRQILLEVPVCSCVRAHVRNLCVCVRACSCVTYVFVCVRVEENVFNRKMKKPSLLCNYCEILVCLCANDRASPRAWSCG